MVPIATENYFSVKNRHSLGLQSLHIDILGEILVALVEDELGPSRAWIFSRVCRHWRYVAYSTPRAWRRIRITHLREVALLETWLQNAKASQVEISLFGRWIEYEVRRAEAGGFPDIWRAEHASFSRMKRIMQENASRIQKLHISFPESGYEDISLHASTLQTLSIWIEPPYGFSLPIKYYDCIKSIFSPSIVSGEVSPPLRALYLTNVMFVAPSETIQNKRFMRALSNLETLELDCSESDLTMLLEVLTLSSQTLRRLKISRIRGVYSFPSLPLLESLEIRSPHIDSLSKLPTVDVPLLRSLRCPLVNVPPGVFPLLEELIIDVNYRRDSFTLLSCGKLKKITFIMTSMEDCRKIVKDLLESKVVLYPGASLRFILTPKWQVDEKTIKNFAEYIQQTWPGHHTTLEEMQNEVQFEPWASTLDY